MLHSSGRRPESRGRMPKTAWGFGADGIEVKTGTGTILIPWTAIDAYRARLNGSGHAILSDGDIPDSLPDWYRDLYSIKGFVVAYEDAVAWHQKNGVATETANITAANLRSWWAKNNRKREQPWPTYRAWILRDKRQRGERVGARRPMDSPNPDNRREW
jgi:hypothetical protein